MSGKRHRLPHLDLYNFVEPAASDSPYVLTSPQSLQPMHLLPKTFDEFEDEYDGSEDVHIGYKRFEKDRLKRLHLCREERERIIDRNNPVENSNSEDDYVVEEEELESDESFVGENTSQGWHVLNPDEDGICRETRSEKYKKPSILSYLESNKIETPRISSRRVTQSRGEASNQQLHIDKQTSTIKPVFDILSDSEESDDGQPRSNRRKPPSSIVRATPRTPRSARQQTPRSVRQQTPRSARQQTPRSARESSWSARQTPASPTSYLRTIPSARSIEEETFSPRQSNSGLSNRPLSFTSVSSNAKKKMNSRSRNNQAADFSLEEITDHLPQNVKKNLSNMSATDRKLLEQMMNKASADQQITSFQSLDSGSDGKAASKKRDQEYFKKVSERERKQNDVLWRKKQMEKDVQVFNETNIDIKNEQWESQYKKQANKKQRNLHQKQWRGQEKKRRQEENLKRIAEQDEQWINDLTYQDKLRKFEKDKKLLGSQRDVRGNSSDQTKYEKQKLSEHFDLVQDLEEKHSRAALQFQNMMKQKEFKRTVKSAKERERKEKQEQYLKSMQQDMQSWQQELKEYQDISIKRAEEVVEKRNNSKSQKAHIKRLQKELDHMTLKERLDKEEQLRQEELAALIQLKDERSKVISSEKEDYTKSSREAARASRAVRDIIKEKTIQSSFDKMAANAEKIARIEKLGKNRTPQQNSLVMKHNSTIMLG